jgi:hypothetical protein
MTSAYYLSLPNLQRINFPKMNVHVTDTEALRNVAVVAERAAIEQGATKDDAAAIGLEARNAHITRYVDAATDAMIAVVGDQLVERGLAIKIDALTADVVFEREQVNVNVRSSDLITAASGTDDTTQEIHVHVEPRITVETPPREITFKRSKHGTLDSAVIEDAS